MTSKTNIDFDVCGYWQSQLNEMSSIHGMHDDTVVGLLLFKEAGEIYATNHSNEAKAIFRQLTSKGYVADFFFHTSPLICEWSDLLTVTDIDKVFRQHPKLVIKLETFPSLDDRFDDYDQTVEFDIGHFHLPHFIAEGWAGDKLMDYHTKQLDYHTKQLLVTTGLAARLKYAARRIHRFWRDVCWNPNYAYARMRLLAQD